MSPQYRVIAVKDFIRPSCHYQNMSVFTTYLLFRNLDTLHEVGQSYVTNRCMKPVKLYLKLPLSDQLSKICHLTKLFNKIVKNIDQIFALNIDSYLRLPYK